MKGYIHSLQSLGTVDGPGIRAVVFASGCPLRCIYCHNPDTWNMTEGTLTDAKEIAEKIIKLKPFLKNGGVTFSGGEPIMQADFFCELAKLLKNEGLHIALDTSGCIYNESVEKLVDLCDMVLLDVKMTSEEDYEKYTGAKLKQVLSFLDVLQKKQKEVWIRHVVVPGINDTKEDILKLKDIVNKYTCVTKIELLPFKNLCLEKYESLGLDFKLKDTKPLKAALLEDLVKLI